MWNQMQKQRLTEPTTGKHFFEQGVFRCEKIEPAEGRSKESRKFQILPKTCSFRLEPRSLSTARRPEYAGRGVEIYMFRTESRHFSVTPALYKITFGNSRISPPQQFSGPHRAVYGPRGAQSAPRGQRSTRFVPKATAFLYIRMFAKTRTCVSSGFFKNMYF